MASDADDSRPHPRVVLGVSGGIAAYKACRAAPPVHRVRATTSPSYPPRPRCSSSAPRPGRRCRASRCPPTSGPTSTRCRTSGSARPPTWSSSRRPPRTCWPRRRTGWPTTCSPTPCSPPAARSCSRPAMHTEMWEHPATQENVATLRRRGALVIEPAEGRLTGADTGKGRFPEPGEIFELARRGAGPGWLGQPARPRPAGTCWSRPAGRGSTSTRSASSATAPRVSRATPSPGPPPPAAPRSPWWPPT